MGKKSEAEEKQAPKNKQAKASNAQSSKGKKSEAEEKQEPKNKQAKASNAQSSEGAQDSVKECEQVDDNGDRKRTIQDLEDRRNALDDKLKDSKNNTARMAMLNDNVGENITKKQNKEKEKYLQKEEVVKEITNLEMNITELKWGKKCIGTMIADEEKTQNVMVEEIRTFDKKIDEMKNMRIVDLETANKELVEGKRMLAEDNEKLKEDNTKLKKDNRKLKKDNEDLVAKEKKTREEKRELKKDYDTLLEKYNGTCCTIC